MSTRRKFLQSCSTFLAAAALAPMGAIGKPPSFAMKDISLNELSFAALADLVGTTFRVQTAPSQTVELELVEANLAAKASRASGQRSPQAPDYEGFSLIFRGVRQEPLPQRIHQFEHGHLGRFELFIVPVVSRDTSRMYYEAVFNRPGQESRAAA
jgi:hypothetical protein